MEQNHKLTQKELTIISLVDKGCKIENHNVV